jgi:hypothetical protein
VLLQDLCVVGGRLLVLLTLFAKGIAQPETETDLDYLLKQQVATSNRLREVLYSARDLLASVDPGLYLELAPFLDGKSGLLTRWEQQCRLGAFSTATLFFLSADAIEALAAAGRVGATTEGISNDRDEFVMKLADAIARVHAGQVRDIRRLDTTKAGRLNAEIEEAQHDLATAARLCIEAHTAITAAVGQDAMADLRRSLLRA